MLPPLRVAYGRRVLLLPRRVESARSESAWVVGVPAVPVVGPTVAPVVEVAPVVDVAPAAPDALSVPAGEPIVPALVPPAVPAAEPAPRPVSDRAASFFELHAATPTTTVSAATAVRTCLRIPILLAWVAIWRRKGGTSDDISA